jgi:hypothetical protein
MASISFSKSNSKKQAQIYQENEGLCQALEAWHNSGSTSDNNFVKEFGLRTVCILFFIKMWELTFNFLVRSGKNPPKRSHKSVHP